MKAYRVEATLKFPSCYHSGYEFTIYAKNKAEAIKKARRDATNEGHTKQDGALVYKVIELETAR